MRARDAALRIARALGAVVGYGCFALFLSLVGVQSYRWLRDGLWTHVGTSEGMRIALAHCCLNTGDTGRLAQLSQWLDAPASWLGLHTVLEVVPASLALFVASILGNSMFIYCGDRIRESPRSPRGS